ncbi:hypothetical protein C6500_00210 [Candidatus Poribacteria bacterium]|nr:MAG: hypothetical protein C6500_00210 [Candidatus Poribacteria bacterium]
MTTTITVEHQYFTDDDFVRDEIESSSLYKSEVEAPPSGGTPIHWHAVGLYVYITTGKFRFQDPATGMVHECVRGTKFVIPERTLHIEEEHQGYSAIVGLTKQDVPQPFVREPSELEELLRKENLEDA